MDIYTHKENIIEAEQFKIKWIRKVIGLNQHYALET